MNYYRCIVDCWRFFQRYRNPVDSDEFWSRVYDEGKEISIRYGNSDFVCNIIGSIQKEIDRIARELKSR